MKNKKALIIIGLGVLAFVIYMILKKKPEIKKVTGDIALVPSLTKGVQSLNYWDFLSEFNRNKNPYGIGNI